MKKILAVLLILSIQTPAWADSVAVGGKGFSGGPIGSPLLLPDGSATVPALAFLTDQDGTGTGIYRSAANALSFTFNGTFRYIWTESQLTPAAGNFSDLGQVSAARYWRDLFLARSIQGITTKTLTDNTIASVIQIPCAAGDTSSGDIDYTAFSENGVVESQSMTGKARWSCLNLAGTEVCPTPTEVGVPLHNETTGGTADLTVAWACDTTPANAINIQVTVNTGIAAPTLVELRYRLNMTSGVAATPVVPQ